MSQTVRAKSPERPVNDRRVTWRQDMTRNWVMYLIFIPTAAYFILFHYIPMVGVVIAFEDFKVARGFFGSTWVGLENFRELFTGDTFSLVMRNTVAMALLNMTIGFIAPILLALLMSEILWRPYRRAIQTVTYMPYFVAAVVVCQLVREFVGVSGGITHLLTLLGFERQNWLANPDVPIFWLINCFTDVWQGAGFGSIVYMAAISNVNGDLHEAAAIDGANRWKRLTRITIPSIMPLVVIMLTLRVGLVFTAGFDKILLLYMPSTYDTADVLSTYTYRMAFGTQTNYGLSAASGLFQSVVATTLLMVSNWLNKRATNNSLF